MNHSFDAIIVGAGQAGPPLAGRLTAAGQRVALVERQLFGGTCVNTGCMPTKTLIASARAAHVVRRAAEFGVQIAGNLAMDMQVVKARKDKVTLDARHGVESWLKGMAGCTVFEGHARFESARSLRVGDALLSAERIFLNVGGRASIPELPGIHEVPYLTNTSMMALAELPRHLVIVGGSYIGLEFAQMYRRFGSAVTVVERGPRTISREDAEVSSAVQAILEREGIAFHLNADSIRFARRGSDIAVGTTAGAEVVGSHLLVAVGRRPNTDDLALDKAGVALDARGYIAVDEQLQTNVPGIYALGDCNGRGAFTHTAYNDFEIVAANLLDGANRKLSERIDTYALYIDPPLGRVGLSPAQARKAGHGVRIGMRPMARVGRAVEKAETDGFMQIVVDAQTQAILGATILGVGGDEAIHSILDMMAAKAPYPVLQQAMHIHPTVAELIPTLLGELKP
ncbi:pyruvate/2-oxoglutarate dehydrogenase complex dihydrolipoamide dehydrogenase (E3) component [Rhodoferax ferrireducens]|uniref:Pyruvate/2-oxoglutarate dehydrogenase complex dihydrolipoamide dehydrogenase (E3) component n=1 Tax=Rhodoferax ferrireducens TaxID=192843 RepID=A0ABU2CEA3_9BURK|nr:FAD-containing oxidoreductase [Rhodoferax ferrireducens]MDR7379677.1 pyruvate/2-oxoglutarate dehydrogenase complex dihydrolipoamide dehydrogenase (E3) component [Rhodoferax ferrireducens]